jgi:ATP-dependent DNA helicase RecQ
MFSEYVPVNEDALARKSALSRDEVYHFLVRLSSMNIIRYIPGKKTALVIFTEERLMRKALFISPEIYLNVKERYFQRMNRMLDYAENTARCRQSVLLDYFGEEAEDCGICDVCRAKKERGVSVDETQLITDEIKALLDNERLNALHLVKKIDRPEKKVIEVLRNLLDQNKVLTDENRLLYWNKK